MPSRKRRAAATAAAARDDAAHYRPKQMKAKVRHSGERFAQATCCLQQKRKIRAGKEKTHGSVSARRMLNKNAFSMSEKQRLPLSRSQDSRKWKTDGSENKKRSEENTNLPKANA